MYEKYKNTIYWLAKLFEPRFDLSRTQWKNFADFLLVDENKLKENLLDEKSITTEYVKFNCMSLFNHFMNTFLCISYIREIRELEDRTDDESIKRIISLFYNVVTQLSVMNAELATFMCMEESRFTREYAPQDWKGTYYVENIDFLMNYLETEAFRLDRDNLQLTVKSITYELEARLNFIYCIGVLLIIDSSPYLEDSIKHISKELYLYLITYLKNSRLIGMKLNLNSPHVEIGSRGRNDDTTQMLMVYGYNNYDTYCLRLDLPHKGIEFLHYNNRSPGSGGNEVKSCIFGEKEYLEIIEKYSEITGLSDMFIEYGGLFALKERCNCAFKSNEEKRLFDLLESNHAHISFSRKQHDENSILEFIELLSFFFGSKRETIQSDDYAIKCFNLDKIMMESKILANCIIRQEITGKDLRIDMQINQIVETAIRYGVYERDDEPYGIDDVNLVIDCSMDRITPVLG